MAVHELAAERRTLHGTFARDADPALTITPGDTVVFTTLVSSWATDPSGTRFGPRDPERDRGHALTGPVAIRGARPGDTLKVEVKGVRPAAWGQSGAGGGPWGLNREMGLEHHPRVSMRWAIDRERREAANDFGQRVATRPFMGVMGMPADAPGLQSTIPPRRTGGNIDCRELVAGSVLYLPIEVPNALFSVGDGHAAQGDGEVGGIAIECPMERVELALSLEPHPLVATAYAETPAGLITFGFDEDLDRAAMAALDPMLDILMAKLGLPDRAHALAVATVAIDMRVTQLVNRVRGVHALWRPDALR
jgi:acetamidase/formamidase